MTRREGVRENDFDGGGGGGGSAIKNQLSLVPWAFFV